MMPCVASLHTAVVCTAVFSSSNVFTIILLMSMLTTQGTIAPQLTDLVVVKLLKYAAHAGNHILSMCVNYMVVKHITCFNAQGFGHTG